MERTRERGNPSVYVFSLITFVVILSVVGCTNDANVNSGKTTDNIITNSLGMKFVYISPGKFKMGSPSDEQGRFDNETQHKVSLTKGFYMQATEVTQGQWKAVMEKNPSYFKNCGDECPVESVSWNECQEFISRLNEKEGTDGKYRLPTEAEWEYSCRAGTTGSWAAMLVNNMGWYIRNANRKTQRVAKKEPNAWGLYDMHGNVWEWCNDWYDEYPDHSVTDPEVQ